MVGDSDLLAPRRGAHRGDAPHVPVQTAGDTALDDLEPLLARRVAHHHQRLAVGRPLPMPIAHTVGLAVLADGTFPQRKAEQLAASLHRQAVPGRMDVHRTQLFGRRHELARRLRAVRWHLDLEPPGRIVRRVEQPEVGATLIDDTPAIGLGMAGVVVVVVAVAAQITLVWQAGVEIAHALGVGKEVDAVADPHRVGQVALEPAHPSKCSAAFGVDPEVPRRPATVALPARRVGGVASDEAGSGGAEGEVVDLPIGQHLRRAPQRVERPGAVVAKERLAEGRDEQDPALRSPAAKHHVRAEPCHAASRSALGGHQIDLGQLLVAADIGNPFAIG